MSAVSEGEGEVVDEVGSVTIRRGVAVAEEEADAEPETADGETEADLEVATTVVQEVAEG